MTLTDKQLASIRGRLEAATPGPWVCATIGGRCLIDHHHGQGGCDYRIVKYEGPSTEVWGGPIEEGIPYTDKLDDCMVAGQWDYDYGGIRKALDAEFIAHAPTDIRALLEEVERLREENDFLEMQLDNADDEARGC